jgi:hypothetical protein
MQYITIILDALYAVQKSVDLSLLVVVMMIGVRIKISFAVSVGRRLTGAT